MVASFACVRASLLSIVIGVYFCMKTTPRLPSIDLSGKDDAGVKDDFMSRKADFEHRIK